MCGKLPFSVRHGQEPARFRHCPPWPVVGSLIARNGEPLFGAGYAEVVSGLAGRRRIPHIGTLGSGYQIADEESSVRTRTAQWDGFTFHYRNEAEFKSSTATDLGNG